MRARKIWYSVSCLFSVQYRNWESEQRTFKVGFDAISPKGQRVCVISALSSGPTEIAGVVVGGGVATPAQSHWAFEDDCCRACGLRWKYGLADLSGTVAEKAVGNQGLHWHGMKTTSRNQKKKKYNRTSLRNDPLKSFSSALRFVFRKIEPTRRRRRLKTTAVRLRSAKTRRAWATNSSVCVFYDFFFS